MVMLALASCGGGKADSCEARARALGAYLQGLDRDQEIIQTRVALVVRDDLPRVMPRMAPLVELTATDTMIQGMSADGEALFERLEAVRRRMRDDALRVRDGGAADEVMLAIDGAVAWPRVDDVLALAARAGFTRVTFAFARTPAAASPPPPSKIDDKLTAIFESDSHDKATRFAAVARDVVGSCGPLTRAFGSVAADGGDKAERLIAAVAPALVECDCNADLPSVQALFYRLFRVDHPKAWLTLTIASDARPIAAAATDTWRDVAARLAPGQTFAARP